MFANPRNAAAGTLKSQNSAVVAARGLDAYLYYLLGENLPADTHYENLQYARSWGFKVSDAVRKLHSVEGERVYQLLGHGAEESSRRYRWNGI